MAVAEHSAEQILLVERGEHQGRGNSRGVEQKVHLVRLEPGPRVWTGAGADRDDQHTVGTRWPTRFGLCGPIAIERRHQEHLESRVVVHRHAAVDENEFPLSGRSGARQHDDLGREIGRGGGAGANQLPERELEVAVGASAVVVLGVGVVRDRPRRVGGRIAHDQQKQGPQLFGAERGVNVEHFPELLGERLILELVAQATQQVRLDKHLGAGFLVKVENFTDRHTDRRARRR